MADVSLSRKRTSSFSSSPTRPAKQQRTMGLKRTESMLLVTEPRPARTTTTTATLSISSAPAVPYHLSLQYYKDQRQVQKKTSQRTWANEPITIRTRLEITHSTPLPTQRHPTPPLIQKSQKKPTPPKQYPPPPAPRLSSPLAPERKPLPSRPCFPRSKTEPDWHKKAITACMRASPSGKQILRMGARNAVSVLSATRELEKMVEQAEQKDRDVVMADAEGESEEESEPAMSRSWVVVKGAEDWEMMDCTSTPST